MTDETVDLESAGPEPAEPESRGAPSVARRMVGTELGDYRLIRLIGHGSMGVVFEALHLPLGRHVALKILPPGLGATHKAIQRFLREAQAIAQLHHDHIVPIFEIGKSGSTHFYAMQLLDGAPIDEVLREGPLEVADAARLVLTAARAVEFAHQRGIIHRDIKPGNMIRCQDGRLVLTDFGLARPDQGPSLTDSGAMVGTPLYMSPEQIRGRRGDVDRRSDVYSLGATLYEMLAGKPPFSGGSTQEILQRILDDEPAPIHRRRAVPREIEVIALRALEKNKRRRYPTAQALADDLERFLGGEPIEARGTSPWTRLLRRVRRHRTISILSALVVLITLGSVSLFVTASKRSRGALFTKALENAHSHFDQRLYKSAMREFEAALRVHPRDPEAQLGFARALFQRASLWDQSLREHRVEGDLELQERFATPRGAYEDALRRIDQVIAAQPDEPLPYLCRGRIRLNLDDSSWRQQGIDDIVHAERLARDHADPEDWQTHALIADLRLAMAREESLAQDQCSELLDSALTSASVATERCAAQRQRSELTENLDRNLAHLLLLRGDIFYELFKHSENLELYLELCRCDAQRAWDLDRNNRRALDLVKLADSFQETADDPPGPSPSYAPSHLGQELARVGGGLLSWIQAGDESAKTQALVEVLSAGGGALAASWEESEEVRDDLLTAILEGVPRRTEQAVDAGGRRRALAAARSARRHYAAAYGGLSVAAGDWASALDQLKQAVEINPGNAQFHHELSFVALELYFDRHREEELETSRQEIHRSLQISPFNPVYLAHEAEVLLVCADHVEESAPERGRDMLQTSLDHCRTIRTWFPDVRRFAELESEVQKAAQALGVR